MYALPCYIAALMLTSRIRQGVGFLLFPFSPPHHLFRTGVNRFSASFSSSSFLFFKIFPFTFSCIAAGVRTRSSIRATLLKAATIEHLGKTFIVQQLQDPQHACPIFVWVSPGSPGSPHLLITCQGLNCLC